MDRPPLNGNDPGAATLGNFINYYDFHPPEERLNLLPSHLWTSTRKGPFRCLDIGCNTGALTTRVYETITNSLQASDRSSGQLEKSCYMLGIDIDPVLIERAQEMNKYPDQVVFKCLDFMSDKKRDILKSDDCFDVVFCFSVTMWIHLNHGDDGLNRFLKEISEMGKMIVIEPQPWKCYKSAQKRLKKCNQSFPLFQGITVRENVEEYIERYLLQTCGFSKVYESPETNWGRKLTFLQKTEPRALRLV